MHTIGMLVRGVVVAGAVVAAAVVVKSLPDLAHYRRIRDM
jgi:hypothetical protein